MVASPPHPRIADLVPAEGCVAKERPHGSHSRVLWLPGLPRTKNGSGRKVVGSRGYEERVRVAFWGKYPEGPIRGPVRLLFYVVTDGLGDIDNFAKCIADGLKGSAYLDDKTVVHLDAIKLQPTTLLPVGVLILVTPVSRRWLWDETHAAIGLVEAAQWRR